MSLNTSANGSGQVPSVPSKLSVSLVRESSRDPPMVSAEVSSGRKEAPGQRMRMRVRCDARRGGCAVFCTCVEIKRRGGAKRGCVDERFLKVLLRTDRSFFWVGKTTLAKRKIASVQIYLEPCRCQETSVVGVLACWALVSCYKQGRKKKQVRRIVAVFNKGEQLGAERAVIVRARAGAHFYSGKRR